jgi:hypothetical protein
MLIVVLLNQDINWFGHCSGENYQAALASKSCRKELYGLRRYSIDIMHLVVMERKKERKKEYSHMPRFGVCFFSLMLIVVFLNQEKTLFGSDIAVGKITVRREDQVMS